MDQCQINQWLLKKLYICVYFIYLNNSSLWSDWLIRVLILESNRTPTAISPFVSLRLLRLHISHSESHGGHPYNYNFRECSFKRILGRNVLIWTSDMLLIKITSIWKFASTFSETKASVRQRSFSAHEPVERAPQLSQIFGNLPLALMSL